MINKPSNTYIYFCAAKFNLQH